MVEAFWSFGFDCKLACSEISACDLLIVLVVGSVISLFCRIQVLPKFQAGKLFVVWIDAEVYT